MGEAEASVRWSTYEHAPVGLSLEFGRAFASLRPPRASPGMGSRTPGRLPESGADLMSQPTVSRCENGPGLRDLIRLGQVIVDLYCASYATPPETVVLDIDDTVDVVHGHQQLSLFNAHFDERCFLPIHVYDTATVRVPRCREIVVAFAKARCTACSP